MKLPKLWQSNYNIQEEQHLNSQFCLPAFENNSKIIIYGSFKAALNPMSLYWGYSWGLAVLGNCSLSCSSLWPFPLSDIRFLIPGSEGYIDISVGLSYVETHQSLICPKPETKFHSIFAPICSWVSLHHTKVCPYTSHRSRTLSCVLGRQRGRSML